MSQPTQSALQTKPWWQSRTIFVASIAGVASGANYVLAQGMIPMAPQVLHAVQQILDGVTTLASLGAVGSRVVATKVLTK